MERDPVILDAITEAIRDARGEGYMDPETFAEHAYDAALDAGMALPTEVTAAIRRWRNRAQRLGDAIVSHHAETNAPPKFAGNRTAYFEVVNQRLYAAADAAMGDEAVGLSVPIADTVALARARRNRDQRLTRR